VLFRDILVEYGYKYRVLFELHGCGRKLKKCGTEKKKLREKEITF
jgi:hypothetical protein